MWLPNQFWIGYYWIEINMSPRFRESSSSTHLYLNYHFLYHRIHLPHIPIINKHIYKPNYNRVEKLDYKHKLGLYNIV